MAEHRTYKPTGELDGIVIEEMPIHEADTLRIENQANVPEGSAGDAEAIAAAQPVVDEVVERWKHALARRREGR